MRRVWVALCLMLVTTAGCSQSTAPKTEPPVPLAAPRGLAEVTPEQFATFSPVVNRYFHVRKQAVLAGDPEVLWREFPALKEGHDRQAAVNVEADVVARYKGLQVIDGNVEPESYARLKVLVDGDKAVILVNGTEMYLRNDFTESGGQVQLILYLEKSGAGWTLVKSDETTIAEYKAATKK